MARLKRTQVSLLSELAKDRVAMRRAKHESFLATLDRKVAERRRQIADIQFEQASDGKLGIDNEEPEPAPSEPIQTPALNAIHGAVLQTS